MKKYIGLALVALVAGTSVADATCGWVGTQIECAFGSGDVVIGTKASHDATRAGRLGPMPFQGNDELLGGRPSDAGRWRVGIQDVGRDPALCRRFGDESYCY